jgi:hypothetical protein
MEVPPYLGWHLPSPIEIQHLKGCTSYTIPSNLRTSPKLRVEGGQPQTDLRKLDDVGLRTLMHACIES